MAPAHRSPWRAERANPLRLKFLAVVKPSGRRFCRRYAGNSPPKQRVRWAGKGTSLETQLIVHPKRIMEAQALYGSDDAVLGLSKLASPQRVRRHPHFSQETVPSRSVLRAVTLEAYGSTASGGEGGVPVLLEVLGFRRFGTNGYVYAQPSCRAFTLRPRSGIYRASGLKIYGLCIVGYHCRIDELFPRAASR
jgi:hypothetical protein